jgi:hypothetical protein
MTEQEENELICEKLLGWKRADGGWIKPDGFMYAGCGTPTFTTWAEAGLILDALRARETTFGVYWDGDFCTCDILGMGSNAETLPLAVRAAALEYIRASGEPGPEHE